MSKKQITLFDSWSKNSLSQNASTSVNVLDSEQIVSRTFHKLPMHDAAASSVFQSPKYSKTEELADPQFDYEAGKTWIYPTNYPVRDYQFAIVKEALFKNTLVILPTGLGKTFIAAVVMYNIYRWYPHGKVVFMAPTKPLVAQQVDACFKITGISQEDTTQMTGTNAPELRKRMWLNKRVFFLTPQVLVNDIVRNICPASAIKCLVVDEAHKALGNHAYCQVIKEMHNYTSHFRVLALTATPGSETNAVRQVLSNLLISHVEMRSEDSEDVQQYTHIRDIEKVVVPLGDRLTSLKSRFLDVINTYLKRLTQRKVMTSKNPGSLSKFQMLKLRETFSQHPPSNIDRFTYGLAMADFSLCISLYHAYELLLLHGAVSFYNFLNGILNGEKSIPHARSELLKNFDFEEIMKDVKENYISESCGPRVQNENSNGNAKKILPGHPKLEKLLEVVLQHFKTAEKDNIKETRVMIFTQYRDSVKEIVDMLNQYPPMVKVMSFVGQATKSGTGVGYSQKQQLKVLQQFRSGGYNTLVSTCVGEEGLDIGEVDLIVCYDCPKSPIRLVQRMGRTGRLRKGRIIILIAEGKEQQMYNTCEYRKKTVNRAISKGFPFAQFYQNSPSLIPNGVKPVCVKTVVTVKPKKVIQKPKESKNPYLTDEEMIEYNQHVKVMSNNIPVLPKTEFILSKKPSEVMCFRNEPTEASGRSQLSLSDWTLWQTTPQRTHIISHSSKSLLLVKILELIHFPELLTSKNSSFNFSNVIDSPQKNEKILKVQDPSHSFFKQSKITDVLAASELIDDLNENFVRVISSPEKEVLETTSPTLKLSDVHESLPLIQRLFNINLPKNFNKISPSDLKQPPSIEKLSNIDFSYIESLNISTKESSSISALQILNKKIKAKLKRKSKELGRNITFNSTKSFTPIKKVVNSINLREGNPSAFDASFDTTMVVQNENHNEVNDLDELQTVSFDIDFDFADPVCDNLDFKAEDETLLHRISDAHDENKQSLLLNDQRNESMNKLNENSVELKNPSNLRHNQNIPYSYNFPITTKVQEYCESETVIKSDSFKRDKSSNKNNSEIYNISNSLNISSDVSEEKNIVKGSNVLDSQVCMNKHNLQSSEHRNVSHSAHSKFNDSTFNRKSDTFEQCHFKYPACEKNVLNSSKTDTNNDLYALNSSARELYENENLKLQNSSEINLDFNIDFADNDVFDHISDNVMEMGGKGKIYNNTSNSCNISTKVSENIPIQNKNYPVISDNFNENSAKDLSKSENRNDSVCYNTSDKVNKHNKLLAEEHENSTDDCNISFDVSFSFDDNQEKIDSVNVSKLQSITNETTVEYSVTKNMHPISNLEQFNEDANSIVEQLFTSQNKFSAKLDSSFSLPLTVKRCISETEPQENEINCKKRIKTSGSGLLKTPPRNTKFESLNVFKIPAVNKNLSLTKNKYFTKNNLNKSLNFTQESQYGMTQLLALIDSSESLDKNTTRKSFSVTHKSPHQCSEVVDVSSEDEICPTPPKEIAKAKAKFIYSSKNTIKKSLSFESFETHKQSNLQKSTSRIQNDLNSSFPCGQSKLLKNLSETNTKLEVANNKKNINNAPSLGKKIASFNNMMEEGINNDNINSEIIESQPSQKITFDVSFDLPFTQEFSSPLESQSFDLNKAICEESFSDVEIGKGSNNSSIKLSEGSESKPANNLGKETISENVKGINMTGKSFIKENYKTDELDCEDSESLLPSKPLERNILNSPDISYDPLSTKHSTIFSDKNYQNTSTTHIEALNQQKINEAAQSCKNSPIEKNVELNSSLMDKFEQNIFENNISFDLMQLEDAKVSKNNCLLNSKHISNSAHDFEKLDVHYKFTKSIHDLSFEENSELFGNVTSDIFCKDQPLVCKEEKYDNIPYVKASESQNYNPASFKNELEREKDLSLLKTKTLQSKPNPNNSGIFSEEKLLFDLCGDNDETCDLLPLESDSNMQNTVNSKKSICTSKNVEGLPLINFTSDLQKSEELNKATKHFALKNNKVSIKQINKKYSEERVDDVDEDGGFTCEFDLSEAEQKLLQEIEEKSISHQHNNPVSCKDANDEVDSNDDFDDPCQSILKHKILNQKCSKYVANKPATNFSIICGKSDSISKHNLNVKDQSDTSKIKFNKLSSNLKNKTKWVESNVLKNNSCIEEDEDDFQFVTKIPKKSGESSATKERIQEKNTSKKRKKTARHKFLLSQADVSGSDNSDDESTCDDDEKKDGMLESFIDDNSPPIHDVTDQHAIYLQSVKNCDGLPQKFKLKVSENRNHSFSIEPPGEYSNYMLDSFCVSDEDIAYISSENDIECNKKSRHKSKKTKKPSKKLKRVITHDSTTSSESEISPQRKVGREVTFSINLPTSVHDDSVIAPKKHKPKLIIISSDEDNDVFIKPADVKSHGNQIDKNKCQVNHTNSKNNSVVPLADVTETMRHTEKIEFSLNFDEYNDDSSPVTVNRKTEPVNSGTLINATDDKELYSSGNVVCNKPSTSKPEDYDSNSKQSECNMVDDLDVRDVSFDIGWDDIDFPLISDEIDSVSKNSTFVSKTPDVRKSEESFSTVILVDSRELASGKPVISALRSKYNVNPIVMQLNSADYVISNRLAIERVSDSEFTNTSMPPKIIEKIKLMNETYDRSVVIIEKDNRKRILSFNKNTTKYLQFVVHLNYCPSTTVLFSKSIESTSELISDLILQEKKKGYHINVPVSLNPKNQKLYDFYLSFPEVSPVCAFYLMYYFPTLKSFSKSSVEDLKKKCCIPSHKALSLYRYFRNEITFHENS